MRITRVCHLGTSNDVPEMTGESGLRSEWRVTFPISAERELNLSSGIRDTGFGIRGLPLGRLSNFSPGEHASARGVTSERCLDNPTRSERAVGVDQHL